MGLKTRANGIVFQVLILLLSLALYTGCKNEKPVTEVVTTNSNVHLAFAGGGWRAHTGHAAWVMSALDHGKRPLSVALKNVGAISSNSGGSWFSTMLMYSNDFVKDIEAPNAIKDWATTGWLGGQQKIFESAPCHKFKGGEYLACVVYETLPHMDNDLYWNLVVKEIAYKDYLINLPLSGARQAWAKDKSLLLASTLLTSSVVVNEKGLDEQYYQACFSPATAKTNGKHGGECIPLVNTDVTPVTFSSIPAGSNLKAPPFLKAASAPSSYFNLGYSQNPWNKPTTASATIQNPINHDQVPVMVASAASSAAGGFLASEAVNKRWQPNQGLDLLWRESYTAAGEALSFQLKNSTAEFVNTRHMSVQKLADNKVVRLADGGPVDNSGVAQLVSFLQLNNQADGFQIAAFDIVQEGLIPGGKGAVIGTDIASLFGKGLTNGHQFCSGANGTGVCVNVPDLKIFELEALTSTPALMDTSVASGRLIITTYKVTTVNNPTFGITAGTTGYLHAYSCIWPSADTFPENNTPDGGFKAYAEMLDFITSSLTGPNNVGRKHLESVLGL